MYKCGRKQNLTFRKQKIIDPTCTAMVDHYNAEWMILSDI